VSPQTPPERRRDPIEALSRAFESLGTWSFDHRWLVLAGCVVLLAASAALASRVRFDNSFSAFFDNRDPTYLAYQTYRGDFGTDEVAYLVYEAPGRAHGVFDLEVMRRIQGLTRALEEEVPFALEVTSLTNAEYVEGVPGGLEVHDLLEEIPETQEELLAIREKVLRKPLYLGGLVSEDGMHGGILVEMDRSAIDPLEELRLDPEGGDGLGNLYPQVSYQAIEAILARPEYSGLVFHHAGDVALNAVYNEVAARESEQLGMATLLLIALLLFAFFRRPIGVLGPLAVVLLAVLVTLGFVGLVGWSLDFMFIMLPTLLIAVGVADAVHIIAEFRALHAQLGDRREAARRTLYLVGTPCLLTSLTTAAGLASMSVAPIVSIAHFAIYSAVGVVAAFVLTLTLLMVLLSFGRRELPRPATPEEVMRAKGGRSFQRILIGIADFDLRFRRPILVAFGLLFALSAVGISRLSVDSNFLHELGREMPVRKATEHIDEVMGGTLSIVYLFESGEAEGIKDPAFLRDMEALQAEAHAHGSLVRKSYSVGDVLKDISQSWHEEDPLYYRLPESREEVAQFLLLYEMSGGEEVEEYVSGDFSRASLELRLRAVETSVLEGLVQELDEHLAERPPGSPGVAVTGVGALWLRLQDYITHSQIRGFLLAFAVIAALLCAIFRSLRTGLIAMVPNLSPVVLTLGVMGWAGIPLDYVRLLIASVAIGISVDDTIHHLTRFHLEFRRSGSYERALRASMADVGRALFITSAVLVAGFLVFFFSSLDSLAVFGVLLATTIGVALVADFLLMPALVLCFRPFGPETGAALRPDAGAEALGARGEPAA